MSCVAANGAGLGGSGRSASSGMAAAAPRSCSLAAVSPMEPSANSAKLARRLPTRSRMLPTRSRWPSEAVSSPAGELLL